MENAQTLKHRATHLKIDWHVDSQQRLHLTAHDGNALVCWNQVSPKAWANEANQQATLSDFIDEAEEDAETLKSRASSNNQAKLMPWPSCGFSVKN